MEKSDNTKKLALYWTAGRLIVKGTIRLLKVEHPKFEGHDVTPNKVIKTVSS